VNRIAATRRPLMLTTACPQIMNLDCSEANTYNNALRRLD
jgi:hypothetical protein